ncbi:alcohol dehydrogenase catalytic domain-containing protein [Nocardia gipuzkoensis]|uniref:alcohol dehydrogenase catalytic domain-containing protein n=1 Tax=Nocardia gipuzkoensis TaxID=2749991 RepID=UPI00237E4F93|nr:zinc-binding dehydrogenase [Nocardia gipuzkoensis]MDE1668667.1 zinc-binding dehydrogenase [Nocardia gipuzkoensis]
MPRYGGPEVLTLVEEDEPVPGHGEVCVRVLASGVSFTDSLLRAGTYPGGPKPPFTPGYELAGIVQRVGPGCSTLQPGDHVAALVVWGGYAEMVCVRESLAIKVPDDVDPAALVSVIFPYMTAYQLIHRAARAEPGETALYHGAAGRVGVALLELAEPAGLRVYGTAATSDCALVERLGGVPIDYTTEDFLTRVRALNGGGVDVAFDGVGGPVSLRSYRALRRGGRLVRLPRCRATPVPSGVSRTRRSRPISGMPPRPTDESSPAFRGREVIEGFRRAATNAVLVVVLEMDLPGGRTFGAATGGARMNMRRVSWIGNASRCGSKTCCDTIVI